MFRDFALSVRGYSHVKDESNCQDSACAIVEDAGAWALAVVADGHGGKAYFRSDIGSRLAVEVAAQVAREYLADIDTFVRALEENGEKVLRGMEAGILSKWNSAVQEYDAQNKELTEWEQEWCAKKNFIVDENTREKLYGTTLVLTLLAPRFAIAIQNGDGACAAIYEDGGAEFFLPQGDEDQAANLTNSLSSSVAMEHFMHRYVLTALQNTQDELEAEPPTQPAKGTQDATDEDAQATPLKSENTEIAPELVENTMPEDAPYVRPTPKLPVCIMVSTDGLINSCVSPEDFLKFNRRVLSRMDDPDIRQSLERHLFEDRSTKGSQDDISVALVFKSDLNLPEFCPS